MKSVCLLFHRCISYMFACVCVFEYICFFFSLYLFTFLRIVTYVFSFSICFCLFGLIFFLSTHFFSVSNRFSVFIQSTQYSKYPLLNRKENKVIASVSFFYRVLEMYYCVTHEKIVSENFSFI